MSLNTTIGDRDLCAWQPTASQTWVQTRLPEFARKLSQRKDARLVAKDNGGGYLRTYAFKKRLAWAERLICSYTDSQPTGRPLSASGAALEKQTTI